MDIKERFRRWFKLRFAVMYPIAIFVVLFSNCDDRSIGVSIGFIIAGLFIRSWANGYAIKMDKLTTSGPYAFVRHPLYLGTMFIAAGFIVMLKIYYIGIFFIAIMAIVYYRTIKKEEAMLEAKFKNAYLEYKKKVPGMLPAVFPYREGEKWPFSFKRLIKSQEYKLFIWVIIIIIAFHLKDELMIEHELFDAKIVSLIIIAFMLGISDLIIEIVKWKKREC